MNSDVRTLAVIMAGLIGLGCVGVMAWQTYEQRESRRASDSRLAESLKLSERALDEQIAQRLGKNLES